jgi:deoxycytidylate deaminase
MDVETYKTKLKQQLLDSPIKNLTEFSRAVHAEMAAMLSCARTGSSLQNGTLYCTTFPCHNCARHAVYSGIKRIVFVEPYLKSKAIDLHKDSITIEKQNENDDNKVLFEQFVGVGPQRFFDLFSLRLGIGHDIIRKEDEKVISFEREKARLRCGSPFDMYKIKETLAVSNFERLDKEKNKEND